MRPNKQRCSVYGASQKYLQNPKSAELVPVPHGLQCHASSSLAASPSFQHWVWKHCPMPWHTSICSMGITTVDQSHCFAWALVNQNIYSCWLARFSCIKMDKENGTAIVIFFFFSRLNVKWAPVTGKTDKFKLEIGSHFPQESNYLLAQLTVHCSWLLITNYFKILAGQICQRYII